MKSKRICAGMYEVKLGDRTVTINHFSPADGASFTGWVAAADWDRYLYTDPLDTKADAMRSAEHMLNDKNS